MFKYESVMGRARLPSLSSAILKSPAIFENVILSEAKNLLFFSLGKAGGAPPKPGLLGWGF
jgi:hypothetical protein